MMPPSPILYGNAPPDLLDAKLPVAAVELLGRAPAAEHMMVLRQPGLIHRRDGPSPCGAGAAACPLLGSVRDA